MSLTNAFSYQDGRLYCEGVDLEKLAQLFGTPCYVYSKTAIVQNYRTFLNAFQGVAPTICYAVKANSNLSVLRALHDAGSGFDVVSGGELYRLLKIGADPNKIIFSGVGKTVEELEMALDRSLLGINVESLQELETLIGLAEQKGACPQLSLRVNPDVDAGTHPYVATGLSQHKFGFDIHHVPEIIRQLKDCPHVHLEGLGFHIGSQILDLQPYEDAFLKLKALAAEFAASGLEPRYLDLGGGIGIPYQEKEEEADLKRYAQFLEQHRDQYRILFEPGRFIVGNAGVLLNTILYHKVNNERNFLIVDGAMNDLIRPSLYQAYHEVLPLRQQKASVPADVVGPVCESGDFFARDRLLPPLRKGDHLSVMNAGAYGFVASSNYNSRPRSAEILVEGNHYEVVRKRETHEDLVRGEL